jgi:Uma2 family endonuclease
VTAMEQLPTHLYTVGEYAALGETEHRTELQEGLILVSPSPTPDHIVASGELFVQVRTQLPPSVIAIQEVDVDLALVPPGGPGSARRPDLVVVDREALRQCRAAGRMLRAQEVHLVVEIVSPGSHRMDYKIKRVEYADAGIPHYWIVDLDEPVSLLACELTEQFSYVDSGEVTGKFRTGEPFSVDIDLTALLDQAVS